MNPILAFILSEAIKNAPVLAIDLAYIFSKTEATQADWDTLRAKWSVPYEDRIKAAEARAGTAGIP